MSVNWASDGASLAPGSLHLAPLGRGHVVANGPPFGLSLVPPPPQGGICPSADWLFRSLSVGFGRFTISVVLAGVGTDGAIGDDLTVRGGGVGLVQEPADSQGGDMARAVLKRVPNVRRIPIATLGETLSRYIRELSRQLAQARDGSVG